MCRFDRLIGGWSVAYSGTRWRKPAMRTSLLLTALSLICLPLPGTGPAHAQATRTWVSGLGDDINSCTRTAPCKTFAGAISKTASGGEIDCLDAGGFGPVTITKSMTIDCTGTFGSILATGTTGVTVNGAGIAVNLRGLSINGATTGTIGINFVAGYSLNLDKVNVINFISGAATAILFAPNSNGAILNVNDCYVYYNGNTPNGGGIVVEPATGGTAVVTISNCRINDNSDGVRSMGTNGLVVMTIRDSTISDN